MVDVKRSYVVRGQGSAVAPMGGYLYGHKKFTSKRGAHKKDASSSGLREVGEDVQDQHTWLFGGGTCMKLCARDREEGPIEVELGSRLTMYAGSVGAANRVCEFLVEQVWYGQEDLFNATYRAGRGAGSRSRALYTAYVVGTVCGVA
jgi:hypothetical protein